MERKYYISDRIIGVWFSTPNQLKEYYKRMVGTVYQKHYLYYGNISEVKLEEINPHWKQCKI